MVLYWKISVVHRVKIIALFHDKMSNYRQKHAWNETRSRRSLTIYDEKSWWLPLLKRRWLMRFARTVGWSFTSRNIWGTGERMARIYSRGTIMPPSHPQLPLLWRRPGGNREKKAVRLRIPFWDCYDAKVGFEVSSKTFTRFLGVKFILKINCLSKRWKKFIYFLLKKREC